MYVYMHVSSMYQSVHVSIYNPLVGDTDRYQSPVTLLRMRETYELRMKIHKIIFIRTKIP